LTFRSDRTTIRIKADNKPLEILAALAILVQFGLKAFAETGTGQPW
jgi:hypothetical protein